MPLNPKEQSNIEPLGMNPFGVAINGIPFDPGAAEWWHGNRNSGWQYEAMAIGLGMDRNNAHVQPNGSYHYHGIPTGLLEKLASAPKPTLIGYAADGFPIYAPSGYEDPGDQHSSLKRLKSSYRLKSGTRPNGPGGKYDGTYTEDYEYARDHGDLDECNGRFGVTSEYPKGIYCYYVTDSFPYIPRSFKGTPDSSFEKRPRNAFGPPGGFGQGSQPFGQGPPPFGQGPPPIQQDQSPFGQGPPPFGQGPPPFGQGPPP
jgi:YHYH protein